jgi:cytochrome c oxidase cbb3-type subunit IV
MDLNLLRAAVTLLSFAGFIAIVAWAWSRRRKAAFDEAALLPFQDGEAVEARGERR